MEIATASAPRTPDAVLRARAAWQQPGEVSAFEAAAPHGEVRGTIHGDYARDLRSAIAQFVTEQQATGRLRPITNRNVDGVLEMLRSGGAIRTGGSINTAGADEVRVGIRGEISEPTPINYALLHADDSVRNAATGLRELNLGQTGYGPVALVLRPEVLERSTFTAVDSIAAPRLYPPEGVRQAIGDAIVFRMAGAEPPNAHNEHPPITDPHLTRPITEAPTSGDVRRLLTTLPVTEAGTAALPPLPEVQVYGGVTPADVAEIRVHDDAPPAAIAALEEAAAPYGIPVARGPLADLESQAAWTRGITYNVMHAHEARTGAILGLADADRAIATARLQDGWRGVAALWTDVARIVR